MAAFFCFFLNFLAQKGPSDLDLVPEEYSVMIGSYPCNISFHNDQLFHCTINGLLGSSERELPVTVSIHVTARKKKTLSSLFRKYLWLHPGNLRYDTLFRLSIYSDPRPSVMLAETGFYLQQRVCVCVGLHMHHECFVVCDTMNQQLVGAVPHCHAGFYSG